MSTKTKKSMLAPVKAQEVSPKASIYFVRRKDGLFESVPSFTHALVEIRKTPDKVVVNGLTGKVSARMGVLLLAPKPRPRRLPHQEIMEQEIEVIGESVKESIGLRSYDKIRSDACGTPFTLGFSVTVNTGDHEVVCKMTGSIKVNSKATLSLPDPNQPELALDMKEEEKVERIAQQIERDSQR